MEERLHKILARAGVASRRNAEQLIAQGRVSVDGLVVREMGVKVDPQAQRIAVDGERVRLPDPVYFVLHKPKGVVCTSGEKDRAQRAIDFAPPGSPRLFAVGRLDKESEGLIILTNDGDLTARLTHPSYQVPKTYRVAVRGVVDAATLEKLKKGIWLSEGKARVKEARVIRTRTEESLLEVTLTEGMNREVRRLLAKVGHPVRSLVRIRLGDLELGDLRRGAVRRLRKDELDALRSAGEVGTAEPPEDAGDFDA